MQSGESEMFYRLDGASLAGSGELTVSDDIWVSSNW